MAIHSYTKDSLWSKEIERGFSEELTNSRVTFQSMHLHLEESSYRDIVSKVHTFKPDIAVLSDDEAFDSIAKFLLGENIPTFFTGLNRHPKDLDTLFGDINKRIPGIIEHYPVKETLDILMEQKKIQSVAILSSDFHSARLLDNYILQEINSHYPKIKVQTGQYKHLEDWELGIKTIGRNSDAVWLFWPFYLKNRKGKPVPPEEVFSIAKKYIRSPLISLGKIDTDHPLLSIRVDPFYLGKQCASLVYAFIKGRHLSEIGIRKLNSHQLFINTKEAKRIGFPIKPSYYQISLLD